MSCLNRTNMELKPATAGGQPPSTLSLNRTNMELKLEHELQAHRADNRLNRTNMELKRPPLLIYRCDQASGVI